MATDINDLFASVGTVGECMSYIIDAIRNQKLLSDFLADPATTTARMTKVVMSLELAIAGGNGGVPDVDIWGRKLLECNCDEQQCCELGAALEMQPAERSGPISDMIISAIISELMRRLKELFDEWRNQ